MLYLDSSAAVKRYVAETGTALVQAAIQQDPFVATVIITRVEVHAALAAAARAGRVLNLPALVATFRRDWSNHLVISIDNALVDHASDLAERHALRGYDAVQLAAALAASQAAGALRFGTFDLALRRAALAEGLSLL